MSRRDLTPTEKRAWARIARTARPLPGVKPPTPEPKPVSPEARVKPERASDPRPTRPVESPQLPSAPLEDRSSHRAVRRGRMEVDARIDLHGLTQDQADRALLGFLRRQQASGARCILIITGKGRGGEGVLRRNFLHWLETQAARQFLSGWAPAHTRHGGSGAFYAYLRGR